MLILKNIKTEISFPALANLSWPLKVNQSIFGHPFVVATCSSLSWLNINQWFPVIELFMETQTQFTIRSTLGDRLVRGRNGFSGHKPLLHVLLSGNRCIWSRGLKHGGFSQWVMLLDFLGTVAAVTDEGKRNQRNLKIWADVADKICFGRT